MKKPKYVDKTINLGGRIRLRVWEEEKEVQYFHIHLYCVVDKDARDGSYIVDTRGEHQDGKDIDGWTWLKISIPTGDI